jgi:enterochelin esterase-like enzyme
MIKDKLICFGLVLPFALITMANAQQFQTFLDRVNSASIPEKSALVDSFIAAAPSFPYVEQDTCAYFIYRGDATNVSVVLIHWVENFPRLPLSKIPGTNLWYAYANYETDARIEYMFSVNGGWNFDPLNPLRVHLPAELGGDHSELAMPAYVQPPEIEYYPDIPHGTVHDTTFYSAKLRNSRTIKVYTPPFYRPDHGQRYPLALIHDGLSYVDDMYADHVLDYLIAEQKIEPIIAVFVPPISWAGRSDEYGGSRYSQFTAFIFEEVLPFIDRTYWTQTDPAFRAMIGLSASAVISVDLCNKYPDQFGLCGAFSGGNSGSVRGSKKNIKYYLDWGTYEQTFWTQPIMNLRDMLLNQGYQVKWNEWHEGHTIGCFRAHFDEALEFFFSPDNVTAVDGEASIPAQFHLAQNYPNPFWSAATSRSVADAAPRGAGNPSTTISYDLPKSVHVKLVIYDVLGHEVRKLVDERRAAGHHQIAWDSQNGFGSSVPSGLYFYRMKAGEFEMTRKLMLLK